MNVARIYQPTLPEHKRALGKKKSLTIDLLSREQLWETVLNRLKNLNINSLIAYVLNDEEILNALGLEITDDNKHEIHDFLNELLPLLHQPLTSGKLNGKHLASLFEHIETDNYLGVFAALRSLVDDAEHHNFAFQLISLLEKPEYTPFIKMILKKSLLTSPSIRYALGLDVNAEQATDHFFVQDTEKYEEVLSKFLPAMLGVLKELPKESLYDIVFNSVALVMQANSPVKARLLNIIKALNKADAAQKLKNLITLFTDEQYKPCVFPLIKAQIIDNDFFCNTLNLNKENQVYFVQAAEKILFLSIDVLKQLDEKALNTLIAISTRLLEENPDNLRRTLLTEVFAPIKHIIEKHDKALISLLTFLQQPAYQKFLAAIISKLATYPVVTASLQVIGAQTSDEHRAQAFYHLVPALTKALGSHQTEMLDVINAWLKILQSDLTDEPKVPFVLKIIKLMAKPNLLAALTPLREYIAKHPKDMAQSFNILFAKNPDLKFLYGTGDEIVQFIGYKKAFPQFLRFIEAILSGKMFTAFLVGLGLFFSWSMGKVFRAMIWKIWDNASKKSTLVAKLEKEHGGECRDLFADLSKPSEDKTLINLGDRIRASADDAHKSLLAYAKQTLSFQGINLHHPNEQELLKLEGLRLYGFTFSQATLNKVSFANSFITDCDFDKVTFVGQVIFTNATIEACIVTQLLPCIAAYNKKNPGQLITLADATILGKLPETVKEEYKTILAKVNYQLSANDNPLPIVVNNTDTIDQASQAPQPGCSLTEPRAVACQTNSVPAGQVLNESLKRNDKRSNTQ